MVVVEVEVGVDVEVDVGVDVGVVVEVEVDVEVVLMPSIEVNGRNFHYHISPYPARKEKDFYLRALYKAFSTIGITKDYVEVDSWGEGKAVTVKWRVNGTEHKYTCSSQDSKTANIAAIAQVIEMDCKAIRRGLKSFGQVMNQFRLDYMPDGKRVRMPHEVLGIQAEAAKDKDFIEYKYKQLAKQLHPDNKETGSEDKFKELQQAYEILKS